MKRIVTIAVAALFLSACGGGGKGGSSLVPTGTSPTGATQSRTLSIAIKVPAKAQQIHRRAWVSPSTQGIGFLVSPSSITFNPANPPLTQTAALSLTGCPASDCVTNADGSQTYTVSVTIPAGSQAIVVSLWDQQPTNATTFPAGANVVSDDVLNSASYGGSPSQTLDITMYGVPASIAIAPLANQSHVEPDPSGYAIVGSGLAYFTATPLDADGNPIVGDGTGPTLTSVTSTTGLVSENLNNGIVSVRAVNAAAGLVNVVYTSNAASAAANVSAAANIQPIQELWIPAWGATPNGLFGFALDPANGYAPSATPFEFINTGTGSNPFYNTIDSVGDQWYFDVETQALQGYYPAYGSQAPTAILSTPISYSGITANALAADTAGNIWLAEGTSDGYPNGVIDVVTLYGQGGTPPTITAGNPTPYQSLDSTYSSAVASMSAFPISTAASSSYSTSVFVELTNGGLYACTISGSLLCNPVSGVNASSIQAIAIDGAGHLWTMNENGDNLLHVYSIGGTFTSPVMTPITMHSYSPSVGGSQLAATYQGSVWIVNDDGTPDLGIQEFKLSGTSIVAGASLAGSTLFNDGAYGISVAP